MSGVTAASSRPVSSPTTASTAPASTVESPATTTESAEVSRPETPGTRDTYSAGGTTGTDRTPRPGTTPVLSNNPALQGELTSRLQQERFAPITRRSVEPRVADGTSTTATTGTATATGTPQQQAFVQEMAGRGVQASNPPTPEQLRQYFGTYNNRADRPQAQQAYQRYSEAFHVHTASTPRGNEDIQYSHERQYSVNGTLYQDRARADAAAERIQRSGRDVDWVDIDTHDASSWADVNGRPLHEGRRVQDCEGFAYTAQDLLGAAGYRTQQVAVDGTGDTDHAMTLLRDPDRPREVSIASNGSTFTGQAGTASQRALLDRAYTAAGGQTPASYYYGSSQAEAQARMVLAQPAGT